MTAISTPETALDPYMQQQILSMAANLNPYDHDATLAFGNPLLKEMVTFYDLILDHLLLDRINEVGTILQQMFVNITSESFNQLRGSGVLTKLPFLSSMVYSFDPFVHEFDAIRRCFETLESKLEAEQKTLLYHSNYLADCCDSNALFIKQVEFCINAVTHRLQAMKVANQGQDDERECEAIECLGKRMSHLKAASQVTIQLFSQIEQLQQHHEKLIASIQYLLDEALVLWKRQFIVAVSNYQQQNALKVIRTIKVATRKRSQAASSTDISVVEMLRIDHGSQIKLLEEKISKNYQRDILDVTLLQKVNELTRETLQRVERQILDEFNYRQSLKMVMNKAVQVLKTSIS